jgi:hypothetical protein
MTRARPHRRIALALVAATAFGAAGACRALHGASGLEDDGMFAGVTEQQVEPLLQSNLPAVCGMLSFVGGHAEADGEKEQADYCNTPLVQAICETQKPSLAEALVELSTDDKFFQGLIANLPNKAELARDLQKAMDADFKTTLLAVKDRVNICFNFDEYKAAQAYAEQAKTKAFQERKTVARRTVQGVFMLQAIATLGLSQVALNAAMRVGKLTFEKVAGKAVTQKIFTTIFAPKTLLSLRATIAATLCTAGATALAQEMTSRMPESDDACKDVKSWEFAGRAVVGCLSVAGATACNAILGQVNLHALGITSENEAIDAAVTIGELGIWLGCSVGGPVSRAACGFTSDLARQLKQTLMTGTNEWAEACGTTKIGRCIGQWIGQGGWSSNEPWEMPTTIIDADNKWTTFTRCCRCQQVYYQSHAGRFWNDLPVAEIDYLNAMQRGDFEGSHCASLSGRYNAAAGILPAVWYRREGDRPRRNVPYDYYEYRACKDTLVMGDKCLWTKPDQTYRQWNLRERKPSSITLSNKVYVAH